MAKAKGYVWGPINAEDLAPVAATDWVITSGMTGATAAQGRLYAIDRRDHSCNEIFPYQASYAPDERRFGTQMRLDPLRFEPHGIDVAVRDDGVYELLVVNHGWRESVEVFEILLEQAPADATLDRRGRNARVRCRQRCPRRSTGVALS